VPKRDPAWFDLYFSGGPVLSPKERVEFALEVGILNEVYFTGK
jgi:hypothetical protein